VQAVCQHLRPIGGLERLAHDRVWTAIDCTPPHR
jgi:hypothetical protein